MQVGNYFFKLFYCQEKETSIVHLEMHDEVASWIIIVFLALDLPYFQVLNINYFDHFYQIKE